MTQTNQPLDELAELKAQLKAVTRECHALSEILWHRQRKYAELLEDFKSLARGEWDGTKPEDVR